MTGNIISHAHLNTCVFGWFKSTTYSICTKALVRLASRLSKHITLTKDITVIYCDKLLYLDRNITKYQCARVK
jgi:hypothetical protein